MALKPHKHIIKLIEEGGATEATLIRKVGLKNKRALTMQFKILKEYLEMFPIKQSDGTFKLLTEEEVNIMEKQQAAKSALKKEMSDRLKGLKKLIKSNPQKKGALLTKRVSARIETLVDANTRLDKDFENEWLNLKAQKASIEFKLADYELQLFFSKVKEVMPELDNNHITDFISLGTLDKEISKALTEVEDWLR